MKSNINNTDENIGKQLADMKSKLSPNAGLTIPDSYFENLQTRISNKITDPKQITFFNKRFIAVTTAIAAVLLVGIIILKPFNKSNTPNELVQNFSPHLVDSTPYEQKTTIEVLDAEAVVPEVAVTSDINQEYSDLETLTEDDVHITDNDIIEYLLEKDDFEDLDIY